MEKNKIFPRIGSGTIATNALGALNTACIVGGIFWDVLYCIMCICLFRIMQC